ncbi:MAG: DUF1963 domain-containing protein [Ruminococcus sp.]|nr:DUF1963 domain-containing protein [Ruminococcus sp.]
MTDEKTLIDKLIKKHQTKEADILKKYYHNAVYLTSKKYPDSIPIGASKCGGFPDLPPEIEYPTMSEYTLTWINGTPKGRIEHYEKSAMQLMAQINLYELAESGADLENLLPKTGMLYIFWSGEPYDLTSDDYTEYDIAEPDKTDCHKVIYWDGDISTLKRTEPPCPYYSKYFDECLEEYAVGFESGDEYDRQAEYAVEDSCEDGKDFYDITDTDPFDLSENTAKLLGVPQGGNCPEPDDDEVLLFQGDYSEGCLWGEYFIISKKDLKNRNFSRIRFDYDID